MSLLVVFPSRGRPDAARQMLDTFIATRTLPDTHIILVGHKSDPEYKSYKKLPCFVTSFEEGTTLPAKLNLAAKEYAAEYDYIHFIADDARYRTFGWDDIITGGMREKNSAFGYANDLARDDLPNHVFADVRAIKALGWFAFPGSQHLYLDDAWGALGRATSLQYFPDVVIEHMHPFYEKAPLDASYTETNSEERYKQDGVAYDQWLRFRLPEDAKKVRKVMGG